MACFKEASIDVIGLDQKKAKKGLALADDSK